MDLQFNQFCLALKTRTEIEPVMRTEGYTKRCLLDQNTQKAVGNQLTVNHVQAHEFQDL